MVFAKFSWEMRVLEESAEACWVVNKVPSELLLDFTYCEKYRKFLYFKTMFWRPVEVWKAALVSVLFTTGKLTPKVDFNGFFADCRRLQCQNLFHLTFCGLTVLKNFCYRDFLVNENLFLEDSSFLPSFRSELNYSPCEFSKTFELLRFRFSETPSKVALCLIHTLTSSRSPPSLSPSGRKGKGVGVARIGENRQNRGDES